MLHSGTSFIYNKVVLIQLQETNVKHSWDKPGNHPSMAELQETSIGKHTVNILSSWIAVYAINASLINNDDEVNRGLVTVQYFMLYLLSLKARW